MIDLTPYMPYIKYAIYGIAALFVMDLFWKNRKKFEPKIDRIE